MHSLAHVYEMHGYDHAVYSVHAVAHLADDASHSLDHLKIFRLFHTKIIFINVKDYSENPNFPSNKSQEGNQERRDPDNSTSRQKIVRTKPGEE